MRNRINLAKEKGCDGIDPDHLDAYEGDAAADVTGVSVGGGDAAAYFGFLADYAHSVHLAIGLSNSARLLPEVSAKADWAMTEDCARANECETFFEVIEQGKPVFNVGIWDPADAGETLEAVMERACNTAGTRGFSGMVKMADWGRWGLECPGGDLGWGVYNATAAL
jgi:hypothetical protein